MRLLHNSKTVYASNWLILILILILILNWFITFVETAYFIRYTDDTYKKTNT